MMDSVKNITKINKDELDNNILNLKIISKIQENDKLITNKSRKLYSSILE